jgi:hypothetical protein
MLNATTGLASLLSLAIRMTVIVTARKPGRTKNACRRDETHARPGPGLGVPSSIAAVHGSLAIV